MKNCVNLKFEITSDVSQGLLKWSHCPCPGPWGEVLVMVLGTQILVLVLGGKSW